MKRRIFTRGSSRPARPLDWVGATLDVTNANAITSGWLIDPIQVLETFTDPTLMATRAFVAARTQAVQSGAGGGGYAAIGIIAWDGSTSAAPVDPPGPLSDLDFDWINRWVGPVVNHAPAGTFLNMNIFDNTHLSKARRRLPSGTGILVCFEGEGLASFVDYACDIRCLIKE